MIKNLYTNPRKENPFRGFQFVEKVQAYFVQLVQLSPAG